jgi:crotonobetainyl-CoA:carnitine CoA-transferase CaiB-like acyl-CoA transferase
LLREREHPTEGRYVEVGMPVKFSARPGRDVIHAAILGEHSQEVARELGIEVPASRVSGS